MAKINIFSLLATFPNDFKRNAYFCSKLEFLNLEILKFEILKFEILKFEILKFEI